MNMITFLALIANIIGYIFSIWLVVSLIASGFKSSSNKCGQKYGIERYYIDGDFFCEK